MGPQDIALAVVRRDALLLVQRRDRAPFQGLWELPGGKVREGEAPAQAALREACEELGVPARDARWLATHEHRYPDGPWVRLHAFAVELEAPLPEAPHRRWVSREQALGLELLEGTRGLLARL